MRAPARSEDAARHAVPASVLGGDCVSLESALLDIGPARHEISATASLAERLRRDGAAPPAAST